MKKERKYIITEDLLTQYQDASLSNSQSLLNEANLLFKQGYNARAYFLACAAIEEIGKAHNAFLAKGRDLNNPAVQTKVKKSFDNHESKIISAIVCLARSMAIDYETVKYILKISDGLFFRREKSMYVDVVENNILTIPNKIISKKNAFDIIRLASDCLMKTVKYVRNTQPEKFQKYHDKFFVLSNKNICKIKSKEDFWNYFFHLMDLNKTTDLMYAVVKYHDEYYSKGKKFSTSKSR